MFDMFKIFLYVFLAITALAYGSSVLFVITGPEQEVSGYCLSKILDKERDLSERKFACRFIGLRK